MPLPELFEYQTRTRVVYGPGVVKDIGFEVGKLGGTRAVIVTDRVLRSIGLVDRVVRGLVESGVELAGIYDDVPPNSEVKVVERGAQYAREQGCDVLIAVGGGSVIDTAKGMDVLLALGGSLLDYQGVGVVNQPLLPLIAVPTTAGTGSEVTLAAVIKDDASGLKLEFNSPYMMPNVAVLDPEMTITLPPMLTAATGMDALTHAIEAYVSNQAEPITDALGIHALRMIAQALPAAVKNGGDLEARGEMLLAACIAGLSFSNALCGIVHAMAHACGGRYGVPHGVANSILLPYGMEFNLDSCPERCADIAVAMGAATERASVKRAARLSVAAVRKLSADIGLPRRLRDVGVEADGIPQLAEDALADAMMISNPRPAELPDVIQLLKRAY
ncbi:MAG: iron-containing alcohol dehydrogenase [Chloroflexi bacterium]|nr:iron-containing alcohol dehydrogenase [Chloroflexota bacterium]